MHFFFRIVFFSCCAKMIQYFVLFRFDIKNKQWNGIELVNGSAQSHLESLVLFCVC